MKKKLITTFIIVLILLGAGLSVYFVFIKNNDKTSKKDKVQNSNIIYTDALKDENLSISNDLSLEFGRIKKISDYVICESCTIEDKEIKYDELGDKKIEFYYKTLDGKKNYRYINISVVDTTKPYISVPSYKKVLVNSDEKFIEDFLCADNHTRNINKKLEGEYDLSKLGTYSVNYVATDESGNKAEKTFTLDVVSSIPKSSGSSQSSSTKLNYTDLYNEYKTSNTKVGIDISRWQGDVDFKKLKESNVEFIMIRLGGQDGIDGEYYIDSKFTQNITGALENGFDVGVYFYSYAYTKEEAINQAKYVMEHLKGYKLNLPIVFDWECWNKFNKLGISLYDLTNVQNAFINEVEKNGYRGSRYGSKNYLTNLWQESNNLTWLAHYISSTTYEGEYYMWQRCDTGRVNGINGDVDVDILYLDKYKI